MGIAESGTQTSCGGCSGKITEAVSTVQTSLQVVAEEELSDSVKSLVV